MTNQQQLINHLINQGKTHTWRQLAEMYDIMSELPDTSRNRKKKCDYVRRLYVKIVPQKKIIPSSGNISIQPININNGIHIVIGCVHVPFHNKELIDKLLKLISDHKDNIKGFHIIGDFLEMKSLSPHETNIINSSGLTLGKEYAAGNEILDMIDSILPKDIQKTFIYGNHETWFIRYINDIKNYKIADSLRSPEEALHLRERGYIVKTDWKEDYFNVGKYQILHGIFCTQNPAKAHVDKLKHSCMFAHTHRIGQHYDIDLHGVNIGCMIDINSNAFNYLSRIERNSWKNGFGIINVQDQYSQAEVVVCENNSFFYGGKKY
jgi:hypothetical protein